MRCIVQDQAKVVQNAAKDVPADVESQVTFMAHDFFTEQPVKGAGLYLMRWVLHDWSDEYALRILRALVPAMKDGARVLIHEYIVPEPKQGSDMEQQTLRQVLCLLTLIERD